MSHPTPIALVCLRQALLGGTRVLLLLGAVFLAGTAAFFAVFRFVDPPISAFMLRDRVSGQEVTQTWVPLEAISPDVVRAVVASEDARFCRHGGIDLIEMSRAMAAARKEGEDLPRGASTISMQVVKNLLLWPGQTYLRKGIEIGVTPIMELIWPKRRILEVYLNIAEWGPGIYGIEAAARRHFDRPARSLGRTEASNLAAALPDPIGRRAGRPGPLTRNKAATIRRRLGASSPDLSCLGPIGR